MLIATRIQCDCSCDDPEVDPFFLVGPSPTTDYMKPRLTRGQRQWTYSPFPNPFEFLYSKTGQRAEGNIHPGKEQENPNENNMKPRLTRGQRQYINPFKPEEYPSENWAWGVGEAIKQGKENKFSRL